MFQCSTKSSVQYQIIAVLAPNHPYLPLCANKLMYSEARGGMRCMVRIHPLLSNNKKWAVQGRPILEASLLFLV
jgi:hypothetical protein